MLKQAASFAWLTLAAIAVAPLASFLVQGCTTLHEAASSTTRAVGDPAVQQLLQPVPYGDLVLAVIGASAALVLAVERFIKARWGKGPN